MHDDDGNAKDADEFLCGDRGDDGAIRAAQSADFVRDARGTNGAAEPQSIERVDGVRPE
jgi:hypothetical protein